MSSNAPGTRVRIGDAERDRAVTALGDHYAAGRITREEFDERLERAWDAKTAHDLSPLFADLPGSHNIDSPVRTGGRDTVGFSDRTGRRVVSPRRRPSGPPVKLILLIALILMLVTPVPFIVLVLGVFLVVAIGRRSRSRQRSWASCR